MHRNGAEQGVCDVPLQVLHHAYMIFQTAFFFSIWFQFTFEQRNIQKYIINVCPSSSEKMPQEDVKSSFFHQSESLN